MSAAATAAGYLYASGRLHRSKAERAQREAERAAVALKRERETKVVQPGATRPRR